MGVTVDGEPRLGQQRSLVAGPEHQVVRGTPGNSDRAIDAQVSRRSDGLENLLGRFLRSLGKVTGRWPRRLRSSVFRHGRVRGFVLLARPRPEVGAVGDDI